MVAADWFLLVGALVTYFFPLLFVFLPLYSFWVSPSYWLPLNTEFYLKEDRESYDMDLQVLPLICTLIIYKINYICHK